MTVSASQVTTTLILKEEENKEKNKEGLILIFEVKLAFDIS